MLGLPTETDDDLKGIRRICDLIKGAYNAKPRKKPLRISVSVSTFIPKPFTPFQWEAQASEEEVVRKQRVLRDLLFIRGVSLSTSDYFTSLLEAVLARGDRRLAPVILSAYKNGCVLDGWLKNLNREGWRKAFEEHGVDPAVYTRAIGEDEVLPWDMIDVGVTKKFLLAERHKAYGGMVSGSCLKGCNGCGLADICEAAHGNF